MKRLAITALVLSLAISGFAQDQSKPASAPVVQTVTVASKGLDVRAVLHDLFTQSKKDYILEPNVRFVLYLSLTDMEFEEALQLICKTANLKFELQNGVYMVSPRHGTAAPTTAAEPKPMGKLPVTVLRRKVTTTAQKVDLRELFTSLARQTDLMIEINPKVPSYRLDVTLKQTSLKFALETICRAAGLTYRFTDSQSIEIYVPEDANHVSLHVEPGVKSQ